MAMKIGKKLLAFILSLGCVGAFAACDMSMLNSMLGGGTSENVSTDSTGDTGSSENPSSENVSSENISSDGINSGNTELPKGEQISEEEWHKAFANTYAYSNYTMAVSSHHTFTDGREDTSSYAYQCQPTVMKVAYSDYDIYYALEGNATVQYRKVGNEWVKEAYSGTIPLGSALIKMNLERFEELYEHFTYKEAEGCWYAENILTETNGREMYLYELRVIIENGLVVKVESVSDLVSSNDGVIGRSRSTIIVSDLDKTVVELPKLGNAQQVTENEWKAALSATVNATNVSQSMCYTFAYTDGTANRSYESYMLLQENATYQYGVQNGTPYQQYYAKVDGVDYQYSVSDGVWTRSAMNREMTYTNYQMASTLDPMQTIYADFTFNEEKGVYTCAEVVVPLGEGRTQTMYNAEFGFENGQLVHFYYEIALTNSDGVQNGVTKVTLKYWDYGKTSFELPEIAE